MRLNKARFIKFSALLNSAEKSISRMKHKKMDSYGLDNAHTLCICVLAEAREGLTKTELASSCGVDKAQISRVVTALQKKGYVASDAKQKLYKQKYALTDDGKKVADELSELILDINSYVSGSIPEEQISLFYATFETICENLMKAEEFFESKM